MSINYCFMNKLNNFHPAVKALYIILFNPKYWKKKVEFYSNARDKNYWNK